MKKKLLLLAASIAAGALLMIGMSMAYYTDTEQAVNVVTTGNVSIIVDEEVPLSDRVWDVDQIKDENGKETGGLHYTNILPGATIKKNPVVTNDGANDAYLRMKVKVTVTNESGTELSTEGIQFLNDSGIVWEMGKEKEHFFYADTILTVEDRKSFFQQVRFPTTWGNEYAGANITIDITAEAVQSDNMEVSGEGTAATISAFNGVNIEQYAGK